MAITGVGSRSALAVQALGDMRLQLADLQRQLGTGKKSTTYGGLGIERGLAVGLRAQLGTIDNFGDTMSQVGVRLDLLQTSLTRMAEIGRTVKSVTQLSPFEIDATGRTSAQHTARMQLDELLGLLNTQAGDRYLFGGRAVDRPAAETLDHVLNGDGARAGFLQALSERNQADLGAGLGRLAIPAAAGTVVSVSEDVAGSPFGFKLAGVSTTLTGSTLTGPAGAPPAVTVDLGAVNPNAGESVTFTLNLPDGSSEKLTLTATASATPGPGEFTIGATSAITATNLQAALTTATTKLAATSLSAASAIAAGHDFFDVDAGAPPMRVAGPPFNTATALVAGTSANTVTWYTGEMGTDPARGTAVARVDSTISVSYGVRGNEEAIRWTIEHVAVFAAMQYSASDPNAADRFGALNQRLGPALDVPSGQQKIEDIEAELAGAQTTIEGAKSRHQTTKLTLETLLQGIEEAPQEEVAAQILALQTRLQASLQTTSILYRLSIVNYL